MDIAEQEWHEDPLPGLGAQEELSDDSSSDSESDSDSESKPGRCLSICPSVCLLVCQPEILKSLWSGWMISTSDFGSQGRRFKSCWRQNSAESLAGWHFIAQSFLLSLPLSGYEYSNVERDVKP